jgi:hypothetical protein
MKQLSDLIMKHKGKRICVMGGSPCLAEDINNIEADIWISANEHGAKLREVDYIVNMDENHTVKRLRMESYLKQYSGKAEFVNPYQWSDYQMFRWPLHPRLMNSGVMATWIGYLMGAHPLILAGFDCYKGDPRIVKMHHDYIPHVKCEVRVASGALTKFYPTYDPKEKFKPFVVPEILGEALDGLIKVRVNAHFEANGTVWPIGSILSVSPFEFRRQIKHKSLIEVKDGEN